MTKLIKQIRRNATRQQAAIFSQVKLALHYNEITGEITEVKNLDDLKQFYSNNLKAKLMEVFDYGLVFNYHIETENEFYRFTTEIKKEDSPSFEQELKVAENELKLDDQKIHCIETQEQISPIDRQAQLNQARKTRKATATKVISLKNIVAIIERNKPKTQILRQPKPTDAVFGQWIPLNKFST